MYTMVNKGEGMYHKQRAFTLIELMVATAVVAILATLAVIASNQNRIKARDVNRKQSVSALTLSMEQQFAAEKSYFVQMPGSGASCPIIDKPAYNSSEDMYLSEDKTASQGLSRCVGYKGGGAGLMNAKNSVNPWYPGLNSITDALFQGGYLGKVPLDPLVNDFSNVVSSERDFLLTLCNSQGLPAVRASDATEFAIYAKLEDPTSLSTTEQDSTTRSCSGPGSPGGFDIDIAARPSS